MLELSIIIPTYNGLRVLIPCLESVMAHRPDHSEVIVVDDGSCDGTGDAVTRRWPAVRLVTQSENRGFCSAINAGLKVAGGVIVETLNNDTEVASEWYRRPLELFEDATVASVAPRVHLAGVDGRLDSAGMMYHVAGWARNLGNRKRAAGTFLREQEVFGATASAAFYRRSALREVGGFPEWFEAYYDDVDVAFRLRQAGYRCIYTPSSVVVHHESSSYGRSERAQRLFHCNEECVFWMNVAGRQMITALPRRLICLALRLVQFAAQRRVAPFLLGKLDAYHARRRLFVERRRRLGGHNRTLAQLDKRFAARLREKLTY